MNLESKLLIYHSFMTESDEFGKSIANLLQCVMDGVSAPSRGLGDVT
jgi:hypothetical protein